MSFPEQPPPPFHINDVQFIEGLSTFPPPMKHHFDRVVFNFIGGKPRGPPRTAFRTPVLSMMR